MPSTEETPGWLRMVVGYSIWFIGVIVLRAVVLSLRGVQDLGYAVNPSYFGNTAYPLGILWLQVFDMAFRTVLIFSVLSLGRRLREILSVSFAKLPRLGRIGYLGAVVGSLIIGYFAYAVLIMQPLAPQRAEWAYKLIFWASLAGVVGLAAYEFAQVLSAAARTAAVAGGRATATASVGRGHVNGATCEECGDVLPANAWFCPSCGVETEVEETQHAPGSVATSVAESTGAQAEQRQKTPASPEDALKTRMVKLTRSTAAGATVNHMLGQFLEIDREFGQYKALLVTFTSPPPEVKRTRLLGIPKSQDLEATALELITPAELERWDRVKVGHLVVLAETWRGDEPVGDAPA